ncbi:McrB family protein [Scytonema sp. PRP1]|uniref:McrB family protein n=1 Tax=Scytonema sp. PRP1 TaxID=3120513 RepID=UPI002FD023B5
MKIFVNPKCPFRTISFAIIEQLANSSVNYFYPEDTELQEYLEMPFQQLSQQVYTQLPEQIIAFLEKGVLNGINYLNVDDDDDDECLVYFDHFFYFKGSGSLPSPQLFIQLHQEQLRFGFYIDDNSIDNRILFFRNCQDYQNELEYLLGKIISEKNIVYGCWFQDHESFSEEFNSEYTLQKWLTHPDMGHMYAAVHISKHEVLQNSTEELSYKIAETFKQLFPLVLLATSNEPMAIIYKYLNIQPIYTLYKCADETSFNVTELESWIHSINRKGQAILYGSPGTGKTFIAEKLAQHLIGGGNGFSELVQFHPAYSYEDFIQGIRPQNEDGNLSYSLVPGRFVQFCKEAENRQGICVLIIDEINRANLAQVFGELMYLFEYRDKEIPLAGGNKFRIPANVRIIGTMNTADRSIALVDYALRRRFAFIELRPNYDLLRRYHQKTGLVVDGLIQTLQRLNQTINDKNYEIGISFFLTDNLSKDIEDIWCMEIEPYLEEFFFNQLEKVNEFRWEKVKQQLSL